MQNGETASAKYDAAPKTGILINDPAACSKHLDNNDTKQVCKPSAPPMQNSTTRTSINQTDISLYSITRKHEAITTKRIADLVLISTKPGEPVSDVTAKSSGASFSNLSCSIAASFTFQADQ
uniref:Uncharacterized protein n=1 Tax=Opuntia streptacantha TaxID=393608 RepID=A0A7C9CW61_OPUST